MRVLSRNKTADSHSLRSPLRKEKQFQQATGASIYEEKRCTFMYYQKKEDIKKEGSTTPITRPYPEKDILI